MPFTQTSNSSLPFCAEAGLAEDRQPELWDRTDLAEFVETSDEWIVARTGIRERHVAAEGETTSDLGYHAALRAMEAAGVKAAFVAAMRAAQRRAGELGDEFGR